MAGRLSVKERLLILIDQRGNCNEPIAFRCKGPYQNMDVRKICPLPKKVCNAYYCESVLNIIGAERPKGVKAFELLFKSVLPLAELVYLKKNFPKEDLVDHLL